MKYEVGDIVVVRPDLKAWHPYLKEDGVTPILSTAYMARCAGRIVKIAVVVDDGCYMIDEEDYKEYYWSAGMFAGKVDEVLKAGAKILVTDDLDKLRKVYLIGEEARAVAGKELTIIRVDAYEPRLTYRTDAKGNLWVNQDCIEKVIALSDKALSDKVAGNSRKYKIGDKVVIVNDRVDKMNPAGGMDEWLGKVMTIESFFGEEAYHMEEDDGKWFWYDNMIDCLYDTQYNVGDKVVVRHDLTSDTDYYMKNSKTTHDIAVEEMIENCGCVLEIERKTDEGYAMRHVGWNWTDEMFLGKVKDVLKPGDQIVITNDKKLLSTAGNVYQFAGSILTVKDIGFCSICGTDVIHVEETHYHFTFDCVHRIIPKPIEHASFNEKKAEATPRVDKNNAKKNNRFKPIDTIVIMSDGNATKAYRKQGGKIVDEVQINRYYTDKHDMLIASQECIKKMKPSFYSGKVRCVHSSVEWWKSGKVYEVSNGAITAEDGDVYPHIKSIEHLREALSLCIWKEVQ